MPTVPTFDLGGSAGSSSTLGSAFGAAGAMFGPMGAVAGNVLGGLFASLGGGGTPNGTNEFDSLHSPTLPQMSAAGMKKPEVDFYVRHAQARRISVEEVKALVESDSRRNNVTFTYAFDAWAFGGSVDGPHMDEHITAYNRENPMAKIYPGTKGPAGAYYSGTSFNPLPGANDYSAAALNPRLSSANPLPPAGFSWTDLSPYLKGAANGAKGGVIDVFTASPTGQQMQRAGEAAVIEKNMPYIVVAGLAFVALAYKAFKK